MPSAAAEMPILPRPPRHAIYLSPPPPLPLRHFDATPLMVSPPRRHGLRHYAAYLRHNDTLIYFAAPRSRHAQPKCQPPPLARRHAAAAAAPPHCFTAILRPLVYDSWLLADILRRRQLRIFAAITPPLRHTADCLRFRHYCCGDAMAPCRHAAAAMPPYAAAAIAICRPRLPPPYAALLERASDADFAAMMRRQRHDAATLLPHAMMPLLPLRDAAAAISPRLRRQPRRHYAATPLMSRLRRHYAATLRHYALLMPMICRYFLILAPRRH